MATIWEQVLGIEKVGIHDNFFDLGGHSLLAVNLFAQITQAFGSTLSLNTLFETPTVEDLARFIDDHRESTPKNRVIPIRAQGTKPPVYWIPGGVGSVLAFRKISDLLGASQPVYGLESRVPEPGEPSNQSKSAPSICSPRFVASSPRVLITSSASAREAWSPMKWPSNSG